MATADFTIADVLAWARAKPADEEYNFTDAANCALGQFLRETRGLSCAQLYADDPIDRVEQQLQQAANNSDDTFGGFVARLEALLPAKPIPSTWAKAEAYMADELVTSA